MVLPRSVFRDESFLFPEYLPHQIPHRDAQLRALELYFQSVVQNASKASQNVMLSGPVGSGKTMLAKKLGESLQKKAALYGNLVKMLHVNCRIDKTLQSVMVRALSALGQNYPSRGYSFEELLSVLVEELRSNHMHLVIAFDEVDSLITSDPSALYTITRLRETAQGSQVFSSLLISKTLDYMKAVDLSTLGQNYPSRGYSFEELLSVLVEELRSKHMHLVIAFDEVDSLITSDPSALYTITRLRETAQGSQVFSSLLISKTLDYMKAVDLSTLSSVQWNEVSLEPYSAAQLLDIIVSRSEAFSDGALGDNSMQLAADIASLYGDARYALDLVYRAGKLADISESPRILPEHIRSAKASLPPGFSKEELNYLSKHQRLILMAVSALLKKGDSTYVTIGEVEKSYSVLCESMGVGANHHTQVWNDVNELSRKGIIETQLSGRGMRGRTTLIGLSLVSAKELMGELEKGMVADARS